MSHTLPTASWIRCRSRAASWTTAAILSLCALVARGQEDGFRPLFNGKDLSGWVLVNTPADTWSVKDGMLICTGKPIGELRTEVMYQNFELELEWRHMVPRGNAGVFIWADDITARGVPFHRGIEVQVLENAYGNTRSHTTHGDIFPIHGATMTPVNGRGGSRAFPTENRSKPSPEWNHYRVVCQDGEISLAVNGKVVTQGKDARPRKGYICLESEGGVVHYRNLRIKELPDTELADADVAIANRGYRSIYSGLDLRGWQASGGGQWHARDWVLAHVPGEQPGVLQLSEAIREDAGLLLDVRFPAQTEQAGQLSVRLGDKELFRLAAKDADKGWSRIEATVRSGAIEVTINGKPHAASNASIQLDPQGSPLQVEAEGAVELANIYLRKLQKP
ncbi:MAG: DUF1080 domain-containing protein [Planctomycetales bacterium]|nr:DUF1080 domain-containing protein [Planctomycetales bacterium]